MAWAGRALLLGSLLLLGACSAPNLRTSDVESQIAQALTDTVGGGFAVTCPTSVPAEAGTGFACTVTDETSGARLTVQVSVQDDKGAYTWQVGGESTSTPTAAPSMTP